MAAASKWRFTKVCQDYLNKGIKLKDLTSRTKFAKKNPMSRLPAYGYQKKRLQELNRMIIAM